MDCCGVDVRGLVDWLCASARLRAVTWQVSIEAFPFWVGAPVAEEARLPEI